MSNVDLIKKYCETRKTKYLDDITPAYAVLFQKLCLYSLTQPNADHKLAKEVLTYYGLNEKGEKVGLKDRGRKKESPPQTCFKNSSLF